MLRTLLLIPLLLALPLSAHAALLQLTATGTVTSSSDANGTVFGLGAGSNTAVGQAITVTFVFDTALAPADSNPSLLGGTYQVTHVLAVSFLSSTWTVNGRTYSSFAATTQNQENVHINDQSSPGDGVTFFKSTLNSAPLLYYYAALGLLATTNGNPLLVQGDALAQPANALTGTGPFSCQCAVIWRDGSLGQDGLAVFSVSSIAYGGYAVPEPALAALLLVACAGALALRRRAR